LHFPILAQDVNTNICKLPVLSDHSRYDPAVLAAILPGLRDLRTPLACGYIWLLNLWLWFGSDLPKPGQGNKLVDRISDLDGVLGTTTLVGAITFTAYLIGSTTMISVGRLVTRFPPEPVYAGRRASFRRRWFKWTAGLSAVSCRQIKDYTERLRLQALDSGSTHFAESKLRLLLGQPKSGPIEVGYTTTLEAGFVDDVFVSHQRRWIQDQVIAEVPEMAAQALTRKERVFDEYDRQFTEAQLRISIALPLATLVFTIAFLVRWWFVFGLLVIPILIIQGFAQLQGGTSVLVQALVNGDISSPTLDRLKALRVTASVEEATR
jgi:hypothetical protein